jgi:hypothetical protein
MITEAILSVFLAIPRFLVSILPTVAVRLPENIFDTLENFLYGVAWFLPITALLPILLLSFAVDIFRAVMALFVRVKSSLPFMGG